MDTIILYLIAGGGLAASLAKDRARTMKALKKALKAFEGILPQFLVILILVAITLIPGFVAFPAAAALLQGGAGATQIAAFVGWVVGL